MRCISVNIKKQNSERGRHYENNIVQAFFEKALYWSTARAGSACHALTGLREKPDDPVFFRAVQVMKFLPRFLKGVVFLDKSVQHTVDRSPKSLKAKVRSS